MRQFVGILPYGIASASLSAMFLHAEPHSYAFSHRFANLLEMSVAQVEPQFDKGITRFNPRMSPCVAAINALFKGHMLDDVGRMCKWKALLDTLHGEDAAQRGRHGVEG